MVNRTFYLVNLQQSDLVMAKNHLFHFGIQQLNVGLFCSIIRMRDKTTFDVQHPMLPAARINELMHQA